MVTTSFSFWYVTLILFKPSGSLLSETFAKKILFSNIISPLYINNNLLLEEDLLSRIVDDYIFSNVLINEWTLLKDRLLVIKDMLFDMDDDIEIKLYKDFVNDLIKFIDNRIVKLQPKFIEKVMVKRFKGE